MGKQTEVITHNFYNLFGLQKQYPGSSFGIRNKMSPVAPFTFDTVELCVVTLNDKP